MASSNDDSDLSDRPASLRTSFSIVARSLAFSFKPVKNTLRVRAILIAGLLVEPVQLMIRRFRC